MGRRKTYSATYFLIFITLITVIAVFRTLPLYYDNQSTYYLQGLHLGDPDILPNDWVTTETRTPHITFTYLVALMQRLEQVEALTLAITFSLHVAFYAAILLIGVYIFRRFDRSFTLYYLIYLTLQSGLIGLLIRASLSGDSHLIWRSFWGSSGLAGQYIYGAYLQPSEFGVLILLAVALCLHNYWRVAVFLLVVATNFHFSYALHTGFIVLTIGIWRWSHKDIKGALVATFGFGLAVLPVAIYSLSFATEPLRAEGSHILALIRQPHHTVPTYWWDSLLNVNTIRFFIMGCTAMLVFAMREKLLSLILVIGFIYTGLAVIIVHLTQNPSLGLLHPWRGSAIFYPLSQVVLFFYIALWFDRYPMEYFRRKIQPRFKSVFIGFLLVGITLFETFSFGTFWQFDIDNRSHTDEVVLLSNIQNRPNAVILVPIEWETFRLEAQQAVYVDWKNHPYTGRDVVEWWRRINVAHDFYGTDQIGRRDICLRETFDYYFVPLHDADAEPARTLGETENYRLMRCPE